MPEPQITKRRVTLVSSRAVGVDSKGATRHIEARAVDYVRPDFLDAYVAAAQAAGWAVEVSDEPDAGPGGYHGATHVPAHLNHPLAGSTFPATPEDQR